MDNLSASARKKIAEISQVADLLPSIVIIHNFPAGFTIEYMSKAGLENLGVTLAELKEMGEKFHDRFFNPEDVKFYKPKLEQLIIKNDPNDVITFFQQVKGAGQSDWQWHLSSIRILCQDENNQPLLTITQATPIDSDFHVTRKVSSLLIDRTFYRDNLNIYNTLSKREKEVLSLVAQAKSNKQIADELFISINTVETHKKKLREKLNISSSAELIRFARAYEL